MFLLLKNYCFPFVCTSSDVTVDDKKSIADIIDMNIYYMQIKMRYTKQFALKCHVGK